MPYSVLNTDIVVSLQGCNSRQEHSVPDSTVGGTTSDASDSFTQDHVH